MTDRDSDAAQREIRVPDNITPERLDRYLGRNNELALSRTRVHQLITEQLVLVDDKPVDPKHKLHGGELISLTVPPPREMSMVGEDIPVEIIYQDEYLAVVNKPAGMVTHPAAGVYRGTLVNALLFHLGKLAHSSGSDRPGIVHRLDKNTSGLLVVARTDEVHRLLQTAIQQREVKRIYLALVCGHMAGDSGSMDLPIGRSLRDRRKMIVTDRQGRSAVTNWKLLKRYRSYDYIEASLETGRTHQIRVHFAHQGHPVFGDPEYGGRQKWHRGMFGPERPLARQLLAMIDRQALHAYKLAFIHPISGEKLAFEAELPEDFARLLETVEQKG
jgi:23S rRNA pseudouridine1911/1915/1917 synthase